jgi:error-prone DNA polymerase
MICGPCSHARALGVSIFQAQAMHRAMVAAEYTGELSDQLRRVMAAWRRSGNRLEHRRELLGELATASRDFH